MDTSLSDGSISTRTNLTPWDHLGAYTWGKSRVDVLNYDCPSTPAPMEMQITSPKCSCQLSLAPITKTTSASANARDL